MAELLKLENVWAGYGDAVVLEDISFALEASGSLALLGRNGMGKTTLIRTLVGHMRASRGRISIRQDDSTHLAAHQVARRGIAYVPEGRGIFPNLSVRENLQLAMRAGVDGRRSWTLERVLDAFPRLRERLAHGGQQLSGGEQQMLAIARALCSNPDVLILDEATEGLAPLIVREVWRIIGEIRASGIASLIVDRNYRQVLAHTDRALILEKGVCVLEGNSDMLAARPDVLTRYLGV
jgi:branched-chain amino acid transport system ATP-binding protein